MFSKKIRDLMIEQDISLQKLADTSGVPFETLRNIYYQKVKDPKVSTAFQLAQALGVTVEYLLGENKYLECEQEEEELIKNYRECGNHGRAGSGNRHGRIRCRRGVERHYRIHRP